MDLDFIAELDVALSNVGSDVVWKRTIGGVELWISPLQLAGQEKVAETITKQELGANIVNESKRMTLSHAVVGIGEHDLRQYRGGAAVFPITGKDGKPTKTTLDKYLYAKLGTWGAEFINDVFAVYADLMESFQKANLKDIKFENAKDPREELAELQARVFELRQQLNLPPLVEGTEPADQELSQQENIEPAEEPPPEPEKAPPVAFDPFAVQAAPPPQPAPPAAPQAAPRPVVPVPPVVRPGPIVVDPAVAARAREAAEIEGGPFAAPIMAPSNTTPIAQAAPAQPPPVRLDVVDKPASREPVSPPVIDRVPVARNPRFKPTPR